MVWCKNKTFHACTLATVRLLNTKNMAIAGCNWHLLSGYRLIMHGPIGGKQCIGQGGGWVVEHNFPWAHFVVCNRAFAWECDTPAGRCDGERTQLWRHRSSWTSASLTRPTTSKATSARTSYSFCSWTLQHVGHVWTNNCEAINYVLKWSVQWQPQQPMFAADRPICTNMPIGRCSINLQRF